MIKAIITDFDGTLVDTYKANFQAYQKAFQSVNLQLSEEEYKKCFGLRFDGFMNAMNVVDPQIMQEIKNRKKTYYPSFFSDLTLNKSLLELLATYKSQGCKIAIASTAQKENLLKILHHFNLQDFFDLVIAGNDVKYGKPNPEIYEKTISSLNVSPSETLIFEDSAVGIQAAKQSGAYYIKISL